MVRFVRQQTGAESETAMEQKKLEIGGMVVFIDAHRIEHNAMVTCIHGDPLGRPMMARRTPEAVAKDDYNSGAYEQDEHGNPVYDYGEPDTAWPCINIVIVSPNVECKDQYGRQLERHTSVVYQSNSSAQGYCFRFASEKLNPMPRQPTVS